MLQPPPSIPGIPSPSIITGQNQTLPFSFTGNFSPVTLARIPYETFTIKHFMVKINLTRQK
jgi:hypothetical protein